MPELGYELGLAFRLLLAAVLGAAIGLEREIHEHPAGMRTHLLVSVGSAAFTILSIEAFDAPGSDPARVAAQIVSGIGFLGAGAILKEGATIRGLTTAASLWAVAAVGMAAGAAAWGVSVTIAVIVVVSLWPLRVVTERFVGRDHHQVQMQLTSGVHDLGRVVEAITAHGGAIAHLASRHDAGGRLAVDVEVRTPDTLTGAEITAAVGDVDGVDLIESTALGE